MTDKLPKRLVAVVEDNASIAEFWADHAHAHEPAMTDKTVAELMALAERMAYVYANEYTHATVPAAAEHAALEQAIRRAVDWQTVAYHDKDQPNGIAWCPGHPDDLRDITPLYARNKP